MRLPLHQLNEFQDAYCGLVDTSITRLENSRYTKPSSACSAALRADLSRFHEQRDLVNCNLRPILERIFTTTHASKTVRDAQLHVQGLCHGAQSDLRLVLEEAGISNVFQQLFMEEFKRAVIEEQNRLLRASSATVTATTSDAIAHYDPEALYHVAGYVLHRASRSKAIPTAVVNALSTDSLDDSLPSDWTRSRDYGSCLLYPTMAFYNAIEVMEEIISEKAPLKSELKSTSLRVTDILNDILSTSIDLPSEVTSHHIKWIAHVFLTIRAYRVIKLAEDRQVNQTRASLALRQSLQ